jgi:predicted permease
MRGLLRVGQNLRRAPGFTVTVVIILGLGIGMATAMFAALRTVLLQRLPVDDQKHLVVLRALGKGGVEVPLAFSAYVELRDGSRTLRGLAGVDYWSASDQPFRDGDEALVLRQGAVTGNFFQVLGASPAIGRLLRPDDDVKGSERVMVIAYDFWRRHYRSDPRVIGKQLFVPGLNWVFTIVGVAPAGLDYPQSVDYWVPIGDHAVDMVGRLGPDASSAGARAELMESVRRYQQQSSDRRIVDARVESLSQAVYGDVGAAIVVLGAAAGLLLVIACANVSNLLLLRAAARRPELAVRQALGASPWRLLRLLFAENIVVTMLGGLLGLAVASGLLRVILVLAPRELPRADALRLAGTPVALALGVTLLSVALTGLAPLGAARRLDLGAQLRLDGRAGTESHARRRARRALVASQVAIALIVLAAAGLLVRTLERLEHLDLGYETDHLTIVQVIPPFVTDTATAPYFALLDRLLPAIRDVPEVVGVTPLFAWPLTGANTYAGALEVEGHPPPSGESNPIVSVDAVGVGFFDTFRLPILRGRGFTDADRAGGLRVAVVSEATRRLYWPGQDPVGRRVRFLGDTTAAGWRTVVGVSSDIHYREFREQTPTIFLPYRQDYWSTTLAIRTRGDAAAAIRNIRATVQHSAPGVVFWRAEAMNEILAGPLAWPRLIALLLSGFALSALVLAAVGLYGVMAWSVRQRTRELGVRLALGATASRIRREVLREALVMVGAGAIAGAAIGLAGSRFLRALLFQVSPVDAGTFAVASCLLTGVGLAAAYLPARRASHVDPARALRTD